MMKIRLIAAVAGLALVAVACNSKTVTPSSNGTTPAGNSPSTSASPLVDKGTKDATGLASVEVEADNDNGQYYFKPTFLKAKPGEKITVELKNEGNTPHSFTIDSLNIGQTVDPDKSMDIVVTLPASASSDVQFYCRFHVSFGMRGAFFFGSAPQAASAAPASGPSY